MLQRLEACFTQTLRQPMPPTFATERFEALPGWDSITHLSLLLALEKTFSITFTTHEMRFIRDVPSLLTLLEGRCHA
jgi:acyl carrier protein